MSDASKDDESTEKKPYSAPQLIRHGGITELTKGGSTPMMEFADLADGDAGTDQEDTGMEQDSDDGSTMGMA